jgi:hypothetical protein
MNLVPYTVTALSESDAVGTGGRNIVIGAVVTLQTPAEGVVTLHDDAVGANPSTAKTTGAKGQVVVFVEPGEYRVFINGNARGRAQVAVGRPVTAVDSVDALRLQRGRFNGDTVQLLSYHAGLNKGGGVLVWDATSTAADDSGVTFAVTGVATGRWVRLLDGLVTPEMFGARGDGVANDFASLSTWASYVNITGHGLLLGHYKFNSSTPMDFSNPVKLYANAAILDMSDCPVNSVAIRFNAGAETSYNLTTDAIGSNSAMSASDLAASGITAGSFVRLFSDAVLDPGRTNSKIGEIVRVNEIDLETGALVFGYDTSVQVTPPLPLTFVYLVSDNAKIAKVHPMLDVGLFGDCLMIGGADFTTRHIGIEMRTCISPYISKGWVGRSLGNRWLWLRSCLDVTLDIGNVSDSPADTTGYGVSIGDASSDILIKGMVGNQLRHMIATNNSTDLIGIPKRITVDGFIANNAAKSNSGSGAGGDAMDAHAAAIYVTYRNGKIFQPSGQAINIECANVNLENIEIFGPMGANQAIYCYNWTNLAASYFIKNITYYGEAPASGIIRVNNLGSGTVDRVVVDGVNFDSATGVILFIQKAKIASVSNIIGGRMGAPNTGSILFEDCDTVKINTVYGEQMVNIAPVRVRRSKRVFIDDVQVALISGSTQGVIDIDDVNTGQLTSVIVNGVAGWAKSGTSNSRLVGLRAVTGTPIVKVSEETNIPVGTGPLTANI